MEHAATGKTDGGGKGAEAFFAKIFGLVPRHNLRQRILLIALFALLVCAYVFTFMPRTTFEYIDQKGNVVNIGEITVDRPLVQEINVRDGVLKGIRVDFSTYDRINRAEYHVNLLDGNGEVVVSNKFNADSVPMEGTFAVPLPQIPVSAGDRYFVQVYSSQASPGNALGASINISGRNANAPASAGGGALAGSLRMELGYESWSPTAWVLAAAMIAAVGLAILFWSKKLHVNVFVMVLILGVLFALITPITDTPDEQVHVATSFIMADGGFVTEPGVGAPLTLSYENVVANQIRTLADNTLSGVAVTPEADVTVWGTGRLFLGFLPQVVGLWFGKLFRADLMGYFYIGRIFNVLAYAVFAYFAVKKAPRFKLFMAVAALMPMSLMVAGSYNPDGLTYGLALLLGAYFIDLYFNGAYRISWERLAPFLIVLVLLVMVKFTLAAFCLLPFFIPAARYVNKRTKWLGGVASLLLAGAVSLFAVWWVNYSAAGTSSISGDTVTDLGANAMQQLKFLLNNPATAASIFSKSIMRDLGGNLMQLFSLGQLTYDVYGIIVLVYLAFVAAVAFAYTRYEYEPARARGVTPVSLVNRWWILFVILLSIVVTYLALYLTWTPVAADTVLGVQGRYFVPLFVLLPFIGQNVSPLVERGAYERAQYNIQFMAVLFAVVALLTTLLRYY